MTKIIDLPTATTTDANTFVPVYQNGTTKKVSATSLGGGASSALDTSFKNKLVNGAMNVSQRYSSTVVALTTTLSYYLDGWCSVASTTVTGTLVTGRTGLTGALGGAGVIEGFSNCLYIQRQSGTYSGNVKTLQVLESINCYHLAGKSVTLSFWLAKNSGWLGGNITASVITATGTDQSSAQFHAGTATGQTTAGSLVVTPSSTLTRYTLTVTVPSNTAQIAVAFQNSAWTGSGTSSDLIAITGVQLELGSAATEFEFRPYSTELNMCQRYSITYAVLSGNTFYSAPVAAISASRIIGVLFSLPVNLRSLPTMSIVGTVGVYNTSFSFITNVTSISAYALPGNCLSVDISTAGSLSTGGLYIVAIAAGSSIILNSGL